MVNIDEKNVISYNVDLNTISLEEVCKDNAFLKTNFAKHVDNFSYYYKMFLTKFDSYLLGFKKMIQYDLGETRKLPTVELDEKDPCRLELIKTNLRYCQTGTATPASYTNTWILNDRKSKFGFVFINNSFCIVEKLSDCTKQESFDDSVYIAKKVEKLEDMEALANALLEIDMKFEYQSLNDEIKKSLAAKNKDFTIHCNNLLNLANKMKAIAVS